MPFIKWFLGSQKCDPAYYEAVLPKIYDRLPKEPPADGMRPQSLELSGFYQYPISPRLVEIETVAFAENYGEPFALTSGMAMKAYRDDWLRTHRTEGRPLSPRDADPFVLETEFAGSETERVFMKGGYTMRVEESPGKPKGIPFCVNKYIADERVDIDATTGEFLFNCADRPRTLDELSEYAIENVNMLELLGVKVPVLSLEVQLGVKVLNFDYIYQKATDEIFSEKADTPNANRLAKDFCNTANFTRISADSRFDRDAFRWLFEKDRIELSMETINDYMGNRYAMPRIEPYLLDKDLKSYMDFVPSMF